MDSIPDTSKKKGLPTLVGIKAHPRMDLSELSCMILEVPGVEKVYSVVGEFDLITMVRASASSELQSILKDIRQLNGIMSTISFLVMQEFEKRADEKVTLKGGFPGREI